jgi:predicted aldo/keto reductase-like oxidoreductase
MDADCKWKIDRRAFLKISGLQGASLAFSAGLTRSTMAAEAPAGAAVRQMPTRVLGKTGAAVSILGMGGSIDTAGYLTLLRVALNMGINFWDSANSYGNGKNEQVIGEFFTKYPEERKKVFQVTKASRVTDPDRMSRQLDLSLERMQTDYIDLYFMHMLQNPDLLTQEIKSWAERKKKEGKIKFFGFSCHGNMAGMLIHASTLGWVDAVMASYNYQLMNDDGMKRAVDACAGANIGLIAMKTQGQRSMGLPPGDSRGRGGGGPPGSGEGSLEEDRLQSGAPPSGTQARAEGEDVMEFSALSHFMDRGYSPEQAKLKAVWEDERIAVCLSEMTNLTMLKDNVAAAADGVKLTEKDRKMLGILADSSRGLYCNGCMQCLSHMGDACGIPDVLRYLMYYSSYGKRDEARRLFRQMPETVRNTLSTRDYSRAQEACPNRIDIDRAVKEAVRLLG